MVGRKPSLLMPKRKKKPIAKSAAEAQPEKQPKPADANLPDTDEEIVDRPTPSKRVKKVKPHRPKRGVKPSAPQEQLSTEDKRVMRRRRQRRRLIIRIAIMVAVVALGLVVWLNWSVLAPDKIWAWIQDLISGGTGSYPVDLSGTGARRLEQVEDYTVVLTESHLTYLNASGAEMSRYECAYSDALLRSEGKYVLVAEQGGRRLQLTTRQKMIKEWSTTYTICAVALNAEGQCAVLTDGPEDRLAQLCIYDAEGVLRYTRNFNRHAVDVALSPDGSTVSITTVEAVNGSLNTHMELFSTTASGDALNNYVVDDTLLYRIGYLSNGTLAAVHEQGVVLMDTKNGKVSTYTPNGMHVLGYAISGESVALALRAYGDTAGGEVVVVSATGSELCCAPFTGEFRHLSGTDGRFAFLTDSHVYLLSAAGVEGRAEVPSDGQQTVYAGGKAVVMGRTELNVYSVK